eukprot:PhM_4_TR596/c0_g1_i1/m.29956
MMSDDTIGAVVVDRNNDDGGDMDNQIEMLGREPADRTPRTPASTTASPTPTTSLASAHSQQQQHVDPMASFPTSVAAARASTMTTMTESQQVFTLGEELDAAVTLHIASLRKRYRRFAILIFENRTPHREMLFDDGVHFDSGEVLTTPPPMLPPNMGAVVVVVNKGMSMWTGVSGVCRMRLVHSDPTLLPRDDDPTSHQYYMYAAFSSPFAGADKVFAALRRAPLESSSFCMNALSARGGCSRTPPPDDDRCPDPSLLLTYSVDKNVRRFVLTTDDTQVVGSRSTTSGAAAGGVPFRVVQWNVFARPYFVSYDGQVERLQRIPHFIQQNAFVGDDGAKEPVVDAVVLNELFIESEPTAKAMADVAGLTHSTRRVSSMTKATNGGVVLYSRHPIVEEDVLVFPASASCGADSLAAKGVLYAKLRVSCRDDDPTKTVHVHVFATHLQAWDYPAAVVARREQLRHILAFAQSKRIPSHETVLYAGDFNCDSADGASGAELATMLRELCAIEPLYPTRKDTPYTSDHVNNELAGRDGGDITQKAGEWLDYVVCSAAHSVPRSFEVRAVRARASCGFSVPWSRWSSATKVLTDLSDHYPIVADMVLDVFNC